MSLKLAALFAAAPKKNRNREQILALQADLVYDDGRTKLCHADECDINKIMARFEVTGTISHVNRFEGVYADFSDFDFATHETKLNAGKEIFDQLPGEIRQEFKQNPQAFFNFVNHPDNRNAKNFNLPALAEPGTQLPADKRNAGEPTDPVEPPVPDAVPDP